MGMDVMKHVGEVVKESLVIKNMEVVGGNGMSARFVVIPQRVRSVTLYLDIDPMKLKDLREVCKTKNVAFADPNIPTCCGYIGLEKKGRRKTQEKEIQLVGKDIEKDCGLLPVLVWVANENEELRLPEPVEVRKEVWGTLGAVA